MLITVEQHDQQSRMDLAKRAGEVLRKWYKEYNWAVRCEGMTTICFTEMKLLRWGDMHVMAVHDNAWSNLNDFDAIVKKLGGELLERARESRTHNNDAPVTQLPDGFNPRFARGYKEIRIKLVTPSGADPIELARKRMERDGLIPKRPVMPQGIMLDLKRPNK